MKRPYLVDLLKRSTPGCPPLWASCGDAASQEIQSAHFMGVLGRSSFIRNVFLHLGEKAGLVTLLVVNQGLWNYLYILGSELYLIEILTPEATPSSFFLMVEWLCLLGDIWAFLLLRHCFLQFASCSSEPVAAISVFADMGNVFGSTDFTALITGFGKVSLGYLNLFASPILKEIRSYFPGAGGSQL